MGKYKIYNIEGYCAVFSHSAVSDSVTPWSNLSGSSVHGISQARMLEWIAISFSSQLRDQTLIS